MDRFNRNHQNNQQKKTKRLPKEYKDISFQNVEK